jgi:hypothetical protein
VVGKKEPSKEAGKELTRQAGRQARRHLGADWQIKRQTWRQADYKEAYGHARWAGTQARRQESS